jgi:hypothetical protein
MQLLSNPSEPNSLVDSLPDDQVDLDALHRIDDLNWRDALRVDVARFFDRVAHRPAPAAPESERVVKVPEDVDLGSRTDRTR